MGNVRTCEVSFVDLSGVRHIAEVSAETLFEAAILGLAAIRQEGSDEPGPAAAITIEIKAPVVRHEVTLTQVRHWLESASKSPREKLAKQRLREIMR